MKRSQHIVVVLSAAFLLPPVPISAQLQKRDASEVIWKHPGEINSRNLFYGPGSRALAPAAPFRFVEEDKSGTTPKFKVKDARNVEWSVKLGPEAQSETVATRLVWAVGYFAEDAHYFPRVRITNLQRLSHGQEYIEDGGVVRGGRFESRRSNIKRGESWSWQKNPFVGTRELDGLRVMMILLNNWDVKNSNNRVLVMSDACVNRREARYVVTDLGATLGRASGFGGKRSKNDVDDFISSRFVREVEDGMVDFDYDVAPTGLGWIAIAYPPAFRKQWNKEKAMQDIPVAHAKWIGSFLSRLTSDQLHDAFRAAHYDRATAKAYVQALRERIKQLRQLRDIPGKSAEVAYVSR